MHPLICHALDTASAAEAIAESLCRGRAGERLRTMLGPLGDPVQWAAALCGLHDLGKYAPTFQAVRIDVARRRLPPQAVRDMERLAPDRYWRLDVHHGWITAVQMERVLLSWGASPQVARDVAAVLGGHHGVIPAASTVGLVRDGQVGETGDPRWARWRVGFVEDFLQLRGLEVRGGAWAQVQADTGAMVLLAGLVVAADWVASDRDGLPPVGEGVDVRAYADGVGHTESAKIARAQWQVWQPPKVSFEGLFGRAPLPVQTAVEEALAHVDGPGVMVVAAPTGSGKTQAGLLAAAAMVDRMGLSGFYLAMPTQATSNQTYLAAVELLERTGAQAPLRLLHSSAGAVLAAERARKAAAPAIHASGVDVPEEPHPKDPPQGQGRQDREAREWFAASNRGLLAPMGVGTIDQLLRGVLRGKFNFLRLAGVAGKVVLFDEVHTYDAYQYALLERLLRWLGYLEVPVVLQSATLPASRSRALVGSWLRGAQAGEPSDTAAAACVAGDQVVWASPYAPGLRAVPVRQTPGQEERSYLLRMPNPLRVEAATAWERRVEQALDLAVEGGGQCVAVVHNVAAQVRPAADAARAEVQRNPRWRGIEVFELSAKLDREERRKADQAVRAAFGPPGEGVVRPQGGAVVFGSPLLAEGLDISLDAGVVQLAQGDRMFQAMGRIRRHGRSQGDGPVEVRIAGVWEETKRGRTMVCFPPSATRVVPAALLLRTWVLLRELAIEQSGDGEEGLMSADEWRVAVGPGDIRRMLDALYGPREAVCCPPGWNQRQWRQAHIVYENSVLRQQVMADTNSIPVPRPNLNLAELTSGVATWRGARLGGGSAESQT